MRHNPQSKGWAARLVAACVLWFLFGAGAYAGCPGNVLVNGSFEEGFSPRGASEVEVANGWTPWWQDGPFANEGLNRRPEYKPEEAARYGTRRIRDGGWAQKWSNNYATHHAGLFQQVNVPVNSTVTLRAWAQSWSSSGDDPSVSSGGHYGLSVGIDPTGGTDWTSPNIVWSPRNLTMDNWVELIVRAQAKGGTITVYLRGDAEFKLKHNDAYFDDVCLVVEAPPPTSTPRPRPTAIPVTPTPSLTPIPTSTSTPTLTPTPKPGQIRVLVFDDRNGNSVRDEKEELLAGARIELTNPQRTPIATYTTTGSGEPYSFEKLLPGSYLVLETDPVGYVSTSPNQVAVALLEGAQVDVTFGDRFAPSPTPTATLVPSATATLPPTEIPATATPEPTPPPEPRSVGQSLYEVSGVVVALLAVGLFAGFRLLKARL